MPGTWLITDLGILYATAAPDRPQQGSWTCVQYRIRPDDLDERVGFSCGRLDMSIASGWALLGFMKFSANEELPTDHPAEL